MLLSLRGCVLIALLLTACSRHHAEPAAQSAPPFAADRASHPTRLARHAPSPQQYEPWPSEGPLHVAEYHSDGRLLKGLIARPSSAALVRDGRGPVLVYLHGGFALGPDDVRDCTPFLDAGFIVWAPALRGENGNPGDFELAFGELEDARSAVELAKTIPDADPARIVLFGHSAGGMLTSLLTLAPSLPVIDTGSAGGIYGSDLFDQMDFPFEDAPIERRMRLF